MKLKFKQAYLKPNNTSIIIYYSKDGQEMKYPTGVSISNEKDRFGKFKEWDYKQHTLKPYVQDFDIKREKIEVLLSKANRILSAKFGQGATPSAVELKVLIDQEEIIRDKTINSLITELFNEFHRMKTEYFTAKESVRSLTDYTSTKHLLLDFEADKGKRFKIVDINNQWFLDLLNFARTKRPKKNGDYKFKTKGELVDKTSGKRFSILGQFFEFLKDQKLVTQEHVDMIKRFKRKEIKVIRTDKVTLAVREIHKLYEFEFSNKKLEQIRDVFIFACLTGIRYKDIFEFDKEFIFENQEFGGFIYRKKASKTIKSSGVSYEIPLCDIVLEILAKYDYALPVISNQKSNEYLKDALKETGLFDEITELKHKETGEYKRRYEAVTMHKGRDTFISNLVDTTPLNELMKYTGHTKLSTLQQYIDRKRPISMNYIKIFNK